jgi:hypothetical protein
MPRYHFNLHNDYDVEDDEGTELPDSFAAREYALTNARELIGETIRCGGTVKLSHHIDVTDENGSAVTTVYFRDAFSVCE